MEYSKSIISVRHLEEDFFELHRLSDNLFIGLTYISYNKITYYVKTP